MLQYSLRNVFSRQVCARYSIRFSMIFKPGYQLTTKNTAKYNPNLL
jgi:hypothetical protein